MHKNQIEGQMSFLDLIIENAEPEKKDESIQELVIPDDMDRKIKTLEKWSYVDCEKCDCDFGSRTCFKRRGYVFDMYHHFCKGEDGKSLRSTRRECLKELTEDPPELRKGCWLSSRDFGNNRIACTEECNAVGGGCNSCRRYIEFYGYVETLQERNGMSFGEAVQQAKLDGYDRR